MGEYRKMSSSEANNGNSVRGRKKKRGGKKLLRNPAGPEQMKKREMRDGGGKEGNIKVLPQRNKIETNNNNEVLIIRQCVEEKEGKKNMVLVELKLSGPRKCLYPKIMTSN